MRTLGYVAAIYGSLLVVHWFSPECAEFYCAVVPLVFMGANLILLLAYLTYSEHDESVTAMHVGEVSVYVLFLYVVGANLGIRTLIGRIPPDAETGIVVFVTMASGFIGCLLGAWMWAGQSLSPVSVSDDD